MFKRIVLLSLVLSLPVSQMYAIVYPTLTPTGEIPGGAFQTYFDNMYTTTQCNTLLQVVAGFSPTGVPICVTPTAAGFSLLGQTSGDTVRFDGTDWVRNNFLYNNGVNIGIGTQSPTATLDINGQVRIRGGSPGSGRILMSDVTGIASWYDPLPSLSGSFWAIGGNTNASVQNIGTITNYALPFVTNNIERMRIDTNGNVGIGVVNPTARLEVGGQLRITGGGIGSGRFLVSDATGLASWTDIVPATSFNISGSTLGDTLYYNGADWVRTNNIFHTGANVGIGTSTPGAKLEVAGQVRITGGGVGSGLVLTSDASGLASWQTPVVGGIAGGQPNYIARWLTSTTLGTGTIFDNGTNVGIGKTNPTRILDIAGDILVNNISLGRGSGNFEENTVLGWNAFTSNTSGQYNTAIGQYALTSNTTGFWNAAIGSATLSSNTTGSRNTAVGQNALNENLDGGNNTAVGDRSLQRNVSGNFNTAIGATALNSNITGTNNVAVGNGALQANTTAGGNTAIGVSSLQSNTTGDFNTAVGMYSLLDNITGSRNTAQGNLALWHNTSGSDNSSYGVNALINNLTGNNNTALGAGALDSNISGNNNTAIGNRALDNSISGDRNIGIGDYANVPSSTGSDQLSIGNWIYGDSGNIGIGTGTALTARLSVNGQVRITGGSPGSGRILTSDATGLATWSDGFSGSVTASGIVGGTGSENFLSKFGTGGIGLFSSQIFDNGLGVSIGSSNIGGPFEVWSGGTPIFQTRNQSLGLGANATNYLASGNSNFGIGNFALASISTASNNVALGGYALGANSTGNSNVAIGEKSLENSTGNNNIVLGANAGSSLVSGDNNIFLGSNVQPNISTTSSNQLSIGNWIYGDSGNIGIGTGTALTARLSVNGQVRITGGSPGSGRILTSDATGLATWSDGFSGSVTASGVTGGTQNYITKFGTGGNGLVSSQLFDNGTQVGIGTATPLAGTEFDVVGDGRFTGDLTVIGNLITDTIVNRTVNNVSISGSILPDAASPLVYRDIGSAPQRWNNLYLSGQISIGGGSPGVGRILTSDASGLASWVAGFSGSTTASGITGGTQNYIPKFGPGGNGLVSSLVFDTGTGVAIGSTTPGSRFEVWSGATSILHMRGTNNLGFGTSTVRTATSGGSNVGIGNNVLRTLTTGYSNTAMGVNSAYNNTTGFFNSAFGESALYSNSIGNWNVALGTQGLWTNLDGSYNIALGGQALYSNLSNDNSIAIGYQALRAATADNNIAIGYQAGSGITSGANNIVIGSNVRPISNTASNQLNIGNWLYGTNGNIGIGTGSNLTARLNIDSGTNGQTGLRLPRVNNNSPVFTGSAVGLGIDANGNVVPVSNGDVVVYDALGRNSAAPTPDPDIAGRRIRYDFNKYFQLPTKQSFVVSNGNGAGFNAPYFKEDGDSGICSWNGASGASPYDCAIADPVTGLSASPNNSFTMTARGDNYGYQLALGARGDAPLFARSGRWFGGGTNYGSGLYLADGTTPTPWQKVLTVPANHIEYFYVNIGYNSQLQEIAGGGNIGMGTSNPDMRLVLAHSGTVGSTQEMMRIQRGVQGADANMVNAFGTPYLMIGGQERRTNSIQTIGFGYNLNRSSQPAEIGLVTTNTSGNTQGDLVFATRNATTNTAPSERMRIFSNGNVTIGSANNSARLRIDGNVMIADGTQAAGRVLTSDANGLATWQTPSGGGGGGGSGAYTTVLTSAASQTSNVLGDLGLNSASLPIGYYSFRSTLRFRTAATTTGLGISMVSNGATVTNYGGQFVAQTAANATQTYSNATLGGTTLLSTGVPAANTDYIATYQGVFQVTTAGSVKLQYRSEVNGSNVTIQPGSTLIIEQL